MGWPRDNYLRRQQVLREQLENAKKEKMKQKEEKKVDEATQGQQQPQDADVSKSDTDTDAVDDEEKTNAEGTGETTIDEVEGKADTDADTPESGEKVQVLTSEEKTMDEDEMAKEAGNAAEVASGGDNQEDGVEENTDAEADAAAAASGDDNQEDGVKEITDAEAQDEPEIDDNDNPLLLPLLSAPIDPQTLLDRLNTRRLYARILHFKREQKRKVEEEAAKLLSGENVEGESSGPESGVPGMGGPIQKMYRDLLKEKVTADRIWRKNMTIEEMANLEWTELIRVAELR